MNNKELGSFGENKSCQYLIDNGYEILCRNYRCSLGEIDIVAQQKQTIAFIEVKTRTSTYYGMPAEAVNHRKQEKYYKIAMHYINETAKMNSSYRFDIIEVMVNQRGVSINHITDAYRRTGTRFYF